MTKCTKKMANIYNMGHLLALACGMIRYCVVIVVVGRMCHKIAAAPVAVNVTNVHYKAADCPLWYNDVVYFADGTDLLRYNPADKSIVKVSLVPKVSLTTNAVVQFLVPVSPDSINGNTTLAVGFGNGVALYTWSDLKNDMAIQPYNHLTVITDDDGAVTCAKADVNGQLWVGCSYTIGSQPTQLSWGKVYMVDTSGKVTMKLDNIGVLGDIAWSRKFDWFYYTEYDNFMVFGRSVDKNFTLNVDHKVIFDFYSLKDDGHPNGMTVDYDGSLWVALRMTSKVVKIDPNNGELLMTIDFPEVFSVTSLTFGSSALNELYVTTNIESSNPEEYPKSGDLFHVTDINAIGKYVIEINVKWPQEK